MEGGTMRSQNEMIKKHLLKGNSITPLQALELFGSLRLGARIYDLRKKGLKIKTLRVVEGRKNYAKYYIPQ